MKFKWEYLFLGALLGLALFLRLYQLANTAPFDWDQNRDYAEVQNIVAGRYPLIGPIARGASGFYLGPLYYYLLVPGYLLSGGNPLSLPVTSLLIDTATILLIYLVLKRLISHPVAFGAAAVWGFSRFLIPSAQISWNVILLPAWIISVLFSLDLARKRQLLGFTFLGLAAGLAFHIHATLLLLVPLLIFFNIRGLGLRPYQKWLIFILAVCLPLAPLILYDLLHVGMNYRSALDILRGQKHSPVSWLLMAEIAMSKFGKVIAAIFGLAAKENLWLGVTAFSVTLLHLGHRNFAMRIMAQIGVAAVLFVILFRDLHFPEYYLLPAYLTVITITVSGVFYLFRKSLRQRVIFFTIIAIFSARESYLYLTLLQPNPYSLATKERVTAQIAEMPQPVDVRMSLNPGRDGGLAVLMNRAGVRRQGDAPVKVVITDDQTSPVIIDGELGFDYYRYGAYRVSTYPALK